MGNSLVTVCVMQIHNGGAYGGYGTAGLRPCILLKTDNIKITGGDGMSPETAYTIDVK